MLRRTVTALAWGLLPAVVVGAAWVLVLKAPRRRRGKHWGEHGWTFGNVFPEDAAWRRWRFFLYERMGFEDEMGPGFVELMAEFARMERDQGPRTMADHHRGNA